MMGGRKRELRNREITWNRPVITRPALGSDQRNEREREQEIPLGDGDLFGECWLRMIKEGA